MLLLKVWQRGLAGAERAQLMRAVDQLVGNDVDDQALALDLAAHFEEVRPITVRRLRAKTFGQTTMLTMPVSSSRVMKITPLAVPGCWRTSTRPATRT